VLITRIPKILHYTFGMAADFGGKPWGLIHYVCLKSAIAHIKPDQVLFYYEYEPTGPWWALTRGLVTLCPLKAPSEIFGHPLAHVAHRSDVVRLQKLIEHGGIYLDADVLVQRDFDDLLEHSAVLGRETGVGMANAVILAEPNAPFLVRWLDNYRTFRSKGRDEYWNEHSVELPAKLAQEHPDEITVLSDKAFFWPLWKPDHIEWIFNSTRPIPLDETYANHLWEAAAWPYVEHLTPGQVSAQDTNFHRWARPYLEGLPADYGAPPIGQRLRKLGKDAKERGNAEMRTLKRLLKRTMRRFMTEDQRRRQTFQDIYRHGLWGGDRQSKFYSGVGSRGEAVDVYVENMTAILKAHAKELGRPLVLVDLGCGDFEVGRRLVAGLPDMTYIGCDIVPELVAHNNKTFGQGKVSFRHVDIVVDSLPKGDVCLVRQVLQHLSNGEIADILGRMGEYQFIYVTEGHPAQRMGPINPDKLAGFDVRFNWQTGTGRGVELDQPPFSAEAVEVFHSFAPPHEVIVTQRVKPKALVAA
jgi:hypothetical protein